jgi:sugar-specific transcriptional regulator TrmB
MKLGILGLNEYESKTYVTLVQLGESKAHHISEKSGVPFGRIYDVLNSLQNKGLIRLSMKRPKKFVAEDPKQTLSDILTEKKKELDSISETVENLEKIYKAKPEESVYAIKGKENFSRAIVKSPEPKESQYSIKWNFDANPVWMRLVKNRIRRGVDFKSLGPLKEETKENIRKWLSIGAEIREFPNEGVAIDIIDEKQVVIGLIKSDITLVINDEAFCKMMKSLFENSWNGSKEIKISK